MEVINQTIIYKRGQTFHLYPLGDIHEGSNASDERAIQGKVTEVKDRKDAYWFGMGDYADCIFKDDKRFDMMGLAPWVQKDNIVESQKERVFNLLYPIRDKCWGLLTGNHEETIHVRHQIDFTRNLCRSLDVPYAGYVCFLNLHFRRRGSGETHLVRIHAWHGAGAAQSEGAVLMRLVRLVNDVQADIYLMGHLHKIVQYTPDRLVCKAGRVKSIKLAAAITGSWVKTYAQPHEGEHFNPAYTEMKGYSPTRIGCPIIHITPDEDKFTIES